MAIRPDTPSGDSPQPGITSQDVEDAYQAFAALQKVMRDAPELARNEYFVAVQDAAFARFVLAYEAL